MNNTELLYQIALTHVPQIGPVQAKILIEHFKTASAIFSASKKELSAIENIGEIRASAIKSFTDFPIAEREIAFIGQYNIQPLFITDANYPKRLLHCYDAPPLLYYKGKKPLNEGRFISIIGTRSNTSYGKAITEKFTEALQGHDITIVSGLAFGIDAIAHKAAVQNKLPTIGVLAHGLHTVYPAEHAHLAKEIIETGGLLTEFTSRCHADKHNFPRRNRIVAGISDATIVIETARKGGSMITAEYAYSYNRDVFACPGKITDSRSEGCNTLIRQNKAILLTDVEQLLETMGWQSSQRQNVIQKQLFIDLSPNEKNIVNLLSNQNTLHIDEINLKSNLSNSLVAAAILNLELAGIVQSLPGKMYRLA